MRILHACPYSWDRPGGVQVQVRWLTRQLARRGHEVLVLAPGHERPADDHVCIVGRPIGVRYNGSVAPICPSPASVTKIAAALDRFKPDIVHVHEPFVPSSSMFAAWRTEAPVIATFHANVGRSRLFTIATPLIRAVWRRIDLAVAVSDAAGAFVRSRLGVRLDVIPNGLDAEMFQAVEPAPLSSGRKLLFVGRLEPRKGFAVMVRAFATLAAHISDLQLLVIGEGRDRGAVDQLPPRFRRRVVMLGALPCNQLPRYHAAADVFVGPATRGESFGIVLLEAMAAGLPVVASDIPGYQDLVRHDIEGLLVPPGDADRLAAAVSRILADRALAVRLGTAGRARARAFSWETLVERVEAVYEIAMAHPRRRALADIDGRLIATSPSIVRPQD